MTSKYEELPRMY